MAEGLTDDRLREIAVWLLRVESLEADAGLGNTYLAGPGGEASLTEPELLAEVFAGRRAARDLLAEVYRLRSELADEREEPDWARSGRHLADAILAGTRKPGGPL